MAAGDSVRRWWSRQVELFDRATPRNVPDAIGVLLVAIGMSGLAFIGLTGYSSVVLIVPALEFVGFDMSGISGTYVWLGTILVCVGLVLAGSRIRRAATRGTW